MATFPLLRKTSSGLFYPLGFLKHAIHLSTTLINNLKVAFTCWSIRECDSLNQTQDWSTHKTTQKKRRHKLPFKEWLNPVIVSHPSHSSLQSLIWLYEWWQKQNLELFGFDTRFHVVAFLTKGSRTFNSIDWKLIKKYFEFSYHDLND